MNIVIAFALVLAVFAAVVVTLFQTGGWRAVLGVFGGAALLAWAIMTIIQWLARNAS
jgi:hypothetical protein